MYLWNRTSEAILVIDFQRESKMEVIIHLWNYLLFTMCMEKCIHLLDRFVNIALNTSPTLHTFNRNMCWLNSRRLFNISIAATSVTFTENGAQCHRNWWKATHFCLFGFCILLFDAQCDEPLQHLCWAFGISFPYSYKIFRTLIKSKGFLNSFKFT